LKSFHEELSLSIFSVKTRIPLIRSKYKKIILDEFFPNKESRIDNDICDKLKKWSRTPDAIAILTPKQAKFLGLEEIKTVLFCEAEYTSPISRKGLFEYAGLYDVLYDEDFTIAVVIIGKYGDYSFLDLPSLYISLVIVLANLEEKIEIS